MFSHRFRENVPTRVYFEWLILSFSAGNINAGGYLSCHQFVSHVTGFATLAGIDFAKMAWSDSLAVLSIPLFFLLGVVVSGFFTEKQLHHEHKGKQYAPIMWIVALLMAIAGLGGYLGLFGNFGAPANLTFDYGLLAILCAACGLQNAAITSASGATVRTTHLTGLITDLGLGMVRSEIHNLSDTQRSLERKSNFLRLATVLSFTLGSAMGAYAYLHLHYIGFFIPSLLAAYSGWSAHFIHKNK